MSTRDMQKEGEVKDGANNYSKLCGVGLGIGLMLLPLACFGSLVVVFLGSSGAVDLYREHYAMLGIAILAYLSIGILSATCNKTEKAKYLGVLIATGTLLPATMSIITAIIYFVGWADPTQSKCEGKYALFWGSAITMWAWSAAAFIFKQFADARKAIYSSYAEFDKRLCQLKSDCAEALSDSGRSTHHSKSIFDAREEIRCQYNQIMNELENPGLQWVFATGYINIWERLYRAEEALIEIAPQEKIVEGALYDELRLEGSDMDAKQRDDLLVKLRNSFSILEPGAKQFLKGSILSTQFTIVTPSQLHMGSVGNDYSQLLQATGGVQPYKWQITEDSKRKQLESSGLKLEESTGMLKGKATKKLQDFQFVVRVTDNAGLMLEKHFTITINGSSVVIPTSGTDTSNLVARAVLRIVRCVLNEYRGGRWNGLILARNRLMATMFLTSLMIYILLAIALTSHAQRDSVLAASIFYVVGAAIGLGDRLRSDSENKTGIYDYGLSAAGLITIPIFSGFTAISGVVLIAMLPYAGQILGPLHTEPLAIKSLAELREGTVAVDYGVQLEPTGGTAPYKWAIAKNGRGAIPYGLGLSATGVLSGTPTNSGKGSFALQVTDDTGAMVEKMFTLIIKPQPTPSSDLAINSTSPLPSGYLNNEYSARLQAVGGIPPYRWEVTEDAKKQLEASGLNLDMNTGALSSAMLNNITTLKFNVKVRDSQDKTQSKNLALPINKPEEAIRSNVAPKSSAGSMPSLNDIFNIRKNLGGLLVAVIFGLTPRLFFYNLNQLTNKYAADLKSSQPSQGRQA